MDTKGILLKNIYVVGETVKYKFEVSERLRPYFNTNEMFVKYDRSVEDVPQSILVIPFVGSVIALTWLIDSVLWVNEIDETFYCALKDLKVAYQELYPHFRFGGRFVSAYRRVNKIHKAVNEKGEALLLFSGGIDAHVSYINNIEKYPLLCNIQGWLKNPDSTSEAQLADFKDITSFANKRGLETGLIKSNFAILINPDKFRDNVGKKVGDSWWHGFQHSMAFISIAIPLAYTTGRNEIIIASSHSLGSKGICASYPTTDTEFKFAEGGYTTHDAFEMTRQDKVRKLVEYQKTTGEPYPIRVCSFNDHNCGVCPKCFRTILEIISEKGDIEQFGFYKPVNMKEYYENYINSHFIEFGIDREAFLFWPEIKKKIKENYEEIQEKEFVDWFLCTDFVKARKNAVRKYRVHNFSKLAIKKLKNKLK